MASSSSRAAESVLRKTCERHSLRFGELLRVHPRKRIATARVTNSAGKDLLLKAALSTATEDSRDGLKLEHQFFLEGGFRLAPLYELGGEGYYARAYDVAKPVRRWLLEEPSEAAALLPAFVTDLAHGIGEGATVASSPALIDEAVHRASGRLRNLCLSGQAGTQRSALLDGWVRNSLRVAAPLWARELRRVLRRWHAVAAKYASTFGHNDLHFDNVLVTPEGDCRVVDYENLTKPGFWWLDALYFTGTCAAALPTAQARRQLEEAVVAAIVSVEPLMAAEIRGIVALFMAAGLSNGRFRGTPFLGPSEAMEILKTPWQLL